jgi:hypothetical protein
MHITIVGQRQAQAAANAIRRGAGTVRKELAEGLRRPTKAVERDIKQAILGANMAGRRTGRLPRFTSAIPSRGVKRQMARAVESKVTTSSQDPRAEVKLNASHVPLRIQPLIDYFGGRRLRLRHPIMGNRSSWAGQSIPDVWTDAVKPHIEEYRREGQAALDRVVEMIEKG